MKLKVKEVRIATKQADVFDFETPSHTYVLGNGAISHNTQEMFSKQVISGGNGILYSSDWAFIIGRAQEKDSEGIAGYKFTINIEKSRFVREKSKLPFTVYFEGGILKWSGMLDIALETGHVTKPKNGWYTRPCVENDKNWREKDTLNSEFWAPIIRETDFAKVVEKKYKLGGGEMLREETQNNIQENGENEND